MLQYFTGSKQHNIHLREFALKKGLSLSEYGIKTIILARFVPIVRTFAPIVAGIGGMRYKTFITYNIIGGMLWTFLLTLSGYFLGSVFPGTSRYLHIIVVIIIFISILPIVFEWMKQRRV